MTTLREKASAALSARHAQEAASRAQFFADHQQDFYNAFYSIFDTFPDDITPSDSDHIAIIHVDDLTFKAHYEFDKPVFRLLCPHCCHYHYVSSLQHLASVLDGTSCPTPSTELCPFRSNSDRTAPASPCLESQCALWSHSNECCALAALRD